MRRVLGVNVASGAAYTAVVEAPNVVMQEHQLKLAPADNVDEWSALNQFADRIRSEALACRASYIAFAESKKYKGWPYRQAYARIAPEVAACLALAREGLSPRVVAQATAASTFGTNLRGLNDAVIKACGTDVSAITYWDERMPAIAVALYVAGSLV